MVFKQASSTSITEIAHLLRARKESGQYTKLFLGARIGGLFGNNTFYEYLRGYSLFNFNSLDEVKKFQECYKILKNYINKEETQLILIDSLKNIAFRDEDRLLAELIQERLFDVIVSTNIDSLLEESFVLKGMKRPKDYMVLNGLDNNRGRLHLQTDSCVVMKVFGDIGSLNYSVPNDDFKLDTRRPLNTFLKNTLLHGTLVLGYDPLWDQSVEQIFMTKTGFCYINEEFPPEISKISDTLESNKGQYLVGLDCQRAIRELHSHLVGSHTPVSAKSGKTVSLPKLDVTGVLSGSLTQKTAPLPKLNERRKIFVSYSHKDKRFLRSFHPYMKQYLRNEQDLFEPWDDTKIQGGQLWDKEIKKAMGTTRVAVLLISVDFFDSDYIMNYELPYLISCAEARTITLVPVIVRPCAFEKSPLYSYQAMNSPSLPLSEMKPNERDKIWNRIAEYVYTIIIEDKG